MKRYKIICLISAISLISMGGTSLVYQEKVNLKSTIIGEQEWTTENLNVESFRNGDPIPEANTYEAWEKASIEGTPAWCYYNQDSKYGKIYGKLYNYWAVTDERKLAPEGWHIPSDEEWVKLMDYLGGEDKSGTSLKHSESWEKEGNGNNKSGFTGLPGGYRSHEGPSYYGGPFFEAGFSGYWWSTTRYLVDNTICRTLKHNHSKLEKNSFVLTAGLSVRLLKD